MLTYCHSRLRVRLKTISAALIRASIHDRETRRLDRFARNEGLVSALWQAWNNFSRSVVLLSAQGTITETGARTNSQYSHLSEAELLFVCQAAASTKKFKNIRPLTKNFLEPTWGDARKINNIVNFVQPSNKATLISGFGLRAISLDIQVVRNACAHISRDRILDIDQIRTKYEDTHFSHPSDALFWTEPSTGNAAWRVWVDELLASAKKVTS